MPDLVRALSPSKNRKSLSLARVLLVHGELAPRLALQTILQAGGYVVDVAATSAEAIDKLDEGRYELVLSHAETDRRPSALNVLAYARVKDYRPATALVTSTEQFAQQIGKGRHQFSVHTED